jgi:NDP-sugar pyrophosphorylase family protein
LAGSYARGRSAFDQLVPRPLLPIVHAPVVVYPLRWLADAGVPGATVCANSAARDVRRVLEETANLRLQLDFSEDWMPRGAAGCARDASLRTNARTFVVVDGTTIPRLDLSALLDQHIRRQAAATVVVHLESLGDNAVSSLSPSGIYVFDRSALEHVSGQGFQDIKEALIPKLHQVDARIGVFKGHGASPRIYDAESYLRANRWAISRMACDGSVPEGYRLHGESFVHTSSEISPRARLVGPVVLGPGVTVEEQATVVGPAAIGANSVVERGAVISRSVAWSSCRVGGESLVDRCLLSDAAVVAQGATLYGTLKIGSSKPAARPQAASWSFSRIWAEAGLRIRPADVPRF